MTRVKCKSEKREGHAGRFSAAALVGAFLQVGLAGVLLSSCSAAGKWRVRDLAGLGRDDLFSGLRYVRSCVKQKTESVVKEQEEARTHAGRNRYPAPATDPAPDFPSLYLLCLFVLQREWAGTCRGGADLTELRLHQGGPFKAAGRAGPGGLVIGGPALNCHL